MAQGSSFNVLYLAGIGALVLLAAVAGLTLTGERHSGFVGSVEVVVLVVAAGLYVAAGLGAANSAGSWPLLVAVAATVLVAVLAFLTLTVPDPGSALIFELAAALMGILLIATISRR